MSLVIEDHSLQDNILETLDRLDRAIFEKPITAEDYRRHFEGRRNLMILTAKSKGTVCGFKIGYEYGKDVFYSYSGGVLPHFRRAGVASALTEEQHRRAGALGYSVVRTHTKNEYREMLLLNLRTGFDVTGVNYDPGRQVPSIILQKRLERRQ